MNSLRLLGCSETSKQPQLLNDDNIGMEMRMLRDWMALEPPASSLELMATRSHLTGENCWSIGLIQHSPNANHPKLLASERDLSRMASHHEREIMASLFRSETEAISLYGSIV